MTTIERIGGLCNLPFYVKINELRVNYHFLSEGVHVSWHNILELTEFAV
jgi:hypothetical protein